MRRNPTFGRRRTLELLPHPPLLCMAKVFLLILVLLAVAMALLCVNIILRKNGTFRSQDVGQSRAMRERGIQCTQAQDRLAQKDKGSIADMMK